MTRSRADLVEIPDACLLVHEDCPLEVARATVDFLAESGQMRA